jgi:hypothetical protein
MVIDMFNGFLFWICEVAQVAPFCQSNYDK